MTESKHNERANRFRLSGSVDCSRTSGEMSELRREPDREILAILSKNSPLHVMDIARIADRHPVTVDRTCVRLHERGQIHPVGRGLYTVIDDGATAGNRS